MREDRTWNGVPLDSDEEYLFLSWYEEAERLGLVSDITRQPEFKLSDKAVTIEHKVNSRGIKAVEKFLLHPHTYRADFSFTVAVEKNEAGDMVMLLDKFITRRAARLIYSVFKNKPVCFVDVKGGWSNHRSRNSSDVTFPVNQKWVYAKYGIFVNKVVISPGKGSFFKNYWAPDEAFRTVKGNPSKVYRACARFDDVKSLSD